MNDNKIELLQQAIDDSRSTVFFGGAGVSTESGIPDFRSTDGLYSQHFAYPPEEILSHDFFFSHTDYFYDFYRNKLLCPGVKPNAAHLKLAELERAGKLECVITQNIDSLHQTAGSRTVYELHGSTARSYCVKCGRFYDLEFMYSCKGVPRCECGALIKPDVVLYGEQLDDETVTKSVEAIANADCLIVAGTSLTVYPAAGFLQYFRGKHLVLINKTPTPLDGKASIVFHAGVGEVLGAVR